MTPSSAYQLRRIAVTRATLIAIVAAGACAGGASSTEVEQIVPTISVVAGTESQTAPVASSLPQTIGVKVSDQASAPLTGYGVGWSVTTGGGTVSSSVSTTDSAGIAYTTWVLGTLAGTQTITATLANGTSVVISAVAQAIGLSSLAVVSDPFVSVSAGSSTTPLQVRALDRYGNSVAGLAHSWSSNGGTLSAATTTTASSGFATATLATESTPRDYVVTATFAGGYAATFVVRGN